MNYKEELTTLITEELLEQDIEITETTSLFKARVLDSLNLTVLVAFIEDSYDVNVKPLDIVFENFDTVENMVNYINKQKSDA